MKAGQIHATSEAIGDFESAVAKFGQSCGDLLRGVVSEIDSSIGFLESEIDTCRSEIERLKDTIRSADEDDDTSWEERCLDGAFDEISRLESSKREVEREARDYLSESRKFELLCSKQTLEARNYLRNLIVDLDGYFASSSDASSAAALKSSFDTRRQGVSSDDSSAQDRSLLRDQEGKLAMEALGSEFEGRHSEFPILSKLSTEEFVALYRYSQHEFEPMNFALRSSDPGELAEQGPKIGLAVLALQKLPEYEGIVYRGAERGQFLDKYRPGEIVTEKAFTSTSSRKDLRLPGDVEFYIESKNGRDISSCSAFKSNEAEVLFTPNTRFEVIDRIDDTQITKIWLRETD